MSEHIQILPAHIQNQIAAGEVVERPASIVKELVENSVDAHARTIHINLERGGIDRITIQDDGSGMSEGDLHLACIRYATSKIRAMEDLTSIRSFGFRGEALASIASISKLTIQTKLPEAPHGFETVIAFGEGVSSHVAQRSSHGTTITIEELFSTLPARRKFLKSPEAEYRACYEIICALALANETVAFELIHNGKPTLHLSACTSAVERAQQIWNLKDSEILEIDTQREDITIKGIIAHPHALSPAKRVQQILVNNRSIKDATIIKAIQEAYVSHRENGTHPFYALSITITPELVDVNVHPRKSEVRFVVPQKVFEAVYQALSHRLAKEANRELQSHTPDLRSYAQSSFAPSPISYAGERSPYAAPLGAPATLRAHPFAWQEESKDVPESEKHGTVQPQFYQLHNKYLVGPHENAILIIDQHALHERIIYERLRAQSNTTEVSSQQLLLPLEVLLTETEHHMLSLLADALRSQGFLWQEHGIEILLTHVPTEIHHVHDITHVFLESLRDDYSTKEIKGGTDVNHIARATIACKSAITFGMRLTEQEIYHLISDFFSLHIGSTCPHGRPIYWLLDEDILYQNFKRPTRQD